MDIELGVLTGHPEYELLFMATQVVRAAGLKDPGGSIRNAKRKSLEGCLLPVEPLGNSPISLPKGSNGYPLHTTTVLMTEAKLYDMLLRGRAPASEPFRKWVTEEVLPTIRKTGKYGA